MVEYECTSERASERAIVKNIAFNNAKAVAKAVWKDTSLRDHVFLEALGSIKREVKNYAKDPTCVLKTASPAAVTSFTNGSFFNQLLQKCPKLSLVLSSIVQPGKAKLYTSEELLNLNSRSRNAICLAAASCLKQYNQQLSAAHYRLSLLLLNGGAKAITFERCAHLGITMSHGSAIKMQNKAGQTSLQCTSWKQDTLEKELKIRFLQEVIHNSPSDAPLDLSKDKVSHLNYYEEEMHRDIMALVRGVRNEEPTVSAPDLFTHKDLVDAVAEVRKSICHYK